MFNKLRIINSRWESRNERKQFVRRAGRKVVDRQVRKTIKAYARARFGSAGYWPHLAHFAEIRGEFIEGWIPGDYFKYVLEPKLNPKAYHNLGDVRTLDYKRFGNFAIKPLFQLISGTYYSPDCKVLSNSDIQDILANHNDTIVIKQEFGWGGLQVRVMHSSEFKPKMLRRNGHRHNYVIQPYLRQHKLISDLYPDSVNTLRVTTFLKKDGTVDVKFVILRFGVDGSKVDNLSSGGQCIYIDNDGRPSKYAYDDMCFQAGETHKNTGYRFSDLNLPMFPDVLEKCKSLHQQYPYNRLIGWDVCINEQGEPKLLEWNTHFPTFYLEDALFGPFFPDDHEF
jgi:hypothetical protein